MQTAHLIDITGCDLVALVQKAYELSRPQGMGFLHFKEGGLTKDEATALVTLDARYPVTLDYVKGRALKLTVHKIEGRLYVNDRWYDHSEDDLKTLLVNAGVVLPVPAKDSRVEA